MLIYVLASQAIFAITPLNWTEWAAVLLLSAPVLVIDEALKFVSVRYVLSSGGILLTCLPRQATFIAPPSKLKLKTE